MRIEEKPWDSEVTGWQCGEVSLIGDNINTAELNKYDLVWAHVPSSLVNEIQFLEEVGFRVVGTRTTMSRNLVRHPSCSAKVLFAYRLASEKDTVGVGDLAANSFSFDRMHRDPRISAEMADQYKRVWGESACSGYADCVYLIADDYLQLAGFVAIRENWLYFIGVRNDCRKSGVGTALVELACEWAKFRGYDKIYTTTQGGNIPAILMYSKCHFDLMHVNVSLHWVNPKRC